MRVIVFLIVSFVSTNVALFELFGSSSYLIEKERQFLSFVTGSNLPPFILSMAEYIHTNAPLLEDEPYTSGSGSDGRLSTWFIPPGQVVVEWLAFSTVFISIIACGPPRYVGKLRQPPTRIARWLFYVCLGTLIAVVYFKFRAWFELGEWFAMLYLLQPCHVLLTGHTILAFLLIRENRFLSVTLFHVLFDLQWFTYVAIALPDTRALIERNFFGEFFLFYFEHLLLILLPLIFTRTYFVAVTQTSVRQRIKRALFSLAWFGIHHIQVMTPLSLVSGVQINYQTHLPQYALPWFGRMYKVAITTLSFGAIIICGFLLDPLVKR